MIQLPFKDLSEDSIIFLSKKQILIDNIEPFKEKANLVAKLWKGKENSKDGKRTYAEIRHTLEEMSARTGICTYCENNESADVEHIFPKKVFPERTFFS